MKASEPLAAIVFFNLFNRTYGIHTIEAGNLYQIFI
jgi:hypothetical protein